MDDYDIAPMYIKMTIIYRYIFCDFGIIIILQAGI